MLPEFSNDGAPQSRTLRAELSERDLFFPPVGLFRPSIVLVDTIFAHQSA
jgi:hypothetical protein